MKVQIAKWGNSAAVRLPKAALDRLGLVPGSEVNLTVEDGVLVITAAEPRLTRDDLIRSMDEGGPEGQSDTVEWGLDRGAEVIDDDYSVPGRQSTSGKTKRAL